MKESDRGGLKKYKIGKEIGFVGLSRSKTLNFEKESELEERHLISSSPNS